jgi:isopenicillin-N epimerase
MGYIEDEDLPKSTHLTPGGTHAFEHRWAMGEAFNFHMSIGKTRVSERIHSLNRQAKEGLATIPGVHVYTPQSDELSAGIIAFEINGIHAYNTVAALKENNIIATQAPYGVSHARLAPGIINTPEDVDYCLKAITAIGSRS